MTPTLLIGSTGFLGSAVHRLLPDAIVVQGRKDIDLREEDAIYRLHSRLLLYDVRTVIHLAYPGTDGIGTALTGMADLIYDQLRIDLHVIKACAEAKVDRLITIGSVCAYPLDVPLPTSEDHLWLGRPEAANEPYGQAKRMQISLLDAFKRQYGLQSVQLIPSNLYGPGDRSGHVIPATIRKMIHAKETNAAQVVIWGSGNATREFVYIDDAADAVVWAATAPEPLPSPINIVSDDEVRIADLATQVRRLVGCESDVVWDVTKPDGQPRRRFTAARALHTLGWQATTSFADGLARTVNDWLAHPLPLQKGSVR